MIRAGAGAGCPGGRVRPAAGRTLLGVALALAAWACTAAPGPSRGAAPGAAPSGARNADALRMVDCLLPGKLRKIGRSAVYATPRRPTRTTAADCEARGGEYTAYDRASSRTSLEVWLPAAEAGDARAQTYVGELYERGIDGRPDYEIAALWYRRAAERGHAPAMVDLGQLYERGLGVAADPATAVAWYRRASGLGDEGTGAAAFVPAESPVREPAAEALREELAQAREERAQAERELAELRGELERARTERDDGVAQERAERTAELAAERERLERARTSLGASRDKLEEQRAALGREREALRRERDALGREAQSSEEADAALARREDALRAREDEIARRIAEAERRRAALDADTKALDAQRAALDAGREALQGREQALAKKERALAARERELARQAAEAEKAAAARPEPVPVAGPEIQLMDPDLPVTRGITLVSAASEAGERLVVGRVVAPAGLLTFTLNGREVEPDGRGLFRAPVTVPTDGIEVALVAVDRQGKRALRSFRLAPQAHEVARAAPSPGLPPIAFGAYHALVVGNDHYRHLPALTTAVADARAVAAVLEHRYGFQVELLLDADRYQMLSALEGMRSRLGESDNFLLYYAGHGELDQVNGRGHWLPVDAEPGSSTNWISNVAVTDVLNAMAARHVLVVADSCYSGTLTRSSLAHMEGGRTEEERVTWLRTLVAKRSRMALTSGALAPVLDAGRGGHSVFARVLLDVLEANGEVLEGQQLHREVAARVTLEATHVRFEQVPQYAPIKFSGHEAGDFFLVPAGG